MIMEIIVYEVSKSVTGVRFEPTPVVTMMAKNKEFRYFEIKSADGLKSSGLIPQGLTDSPS